MALSHSRQTAPQDQNALYSGADIATVLNEVAVGFFREKTSLQLHRLLTVRKAKDSINGLLSRGDATVLDSCCGSYALAAGLNSPLSRDPPSGSDLVGAARLLLAQFAAVVFSGSIWSHFRQTSFVRPVRSVIATSLLLQSGQRLWSIECLRFVGSPGCRLILATPAS